MSLVTPQAVLDIGTNSVKVLVARENTPGSFAVLFDRSVIVRLGEGLAEAGVLLERPMKRTVDAIAFLVKEARSLGVTEFHAVGTQALRIAKNADVFVAEVKERTGVTVAVISGEEEARFSYRAAIGRVETKAERQLVFDVGGGSTELIVGCSAEPVERVSVPLGALNLHDAFFLGRSTVSSAQLSEARARIIKGLEKIHEMALSESEDLPLIGIGGTITTLLRVTLRSDRSSSPVLQGRTLTRSQVDEMVKLFAGMELSQRKLLPGLEEKRAEIILAGACLVSCFLETVNRDHLVVSDRGLRYGLLETLTGGKIC